jgi:nucleoside-diphosphate-sugar epimerase
MHADPISATSPRPLVLGASGRIGTAFRHLTTGGLWPGKPPLWQVRDKAGVGTDAVIWDILATPPPEMKSFRGIICLAGVVGGDLALNTDLALAAIDLARKIKGGPVLLTSTAAVYGRTDGPVDEDAICAPVSPYGQAKLAMERAVAQHLRALGPAAPPCCILRIGNVAGADMLLRAARTGPVVLDQFADGQGPVRSYVGMVRLARIMMQLIGMPAGQETVPPVLNIADPVPIRMTDLLQAAGIAWSWQSAPASAVPLVALTTRRLSALVPDDPGSTGAEALVRQARLAGWSPR